MLVPILSVASEWTAPDGVGFGPPRTHFGDRAAERGVRSIPGDLLKWAVEVSVAQGRTDLAEFVFAIDAQSLVFRVLLPEGPFYPIVTPAGRAVTIYSQSQLRNVRRSRQGYLSETGSRKREARR